MATIHQRHHGWDNAIPPVAEIESGAELAFDVLDASGGQLTAASSAAALGSLDFGRVNPVNGPVFIKGAQPGDSLEVEILSFATSPWGWTGIIPGFGLLADEFPVPHLWSWRIENGFATGLPGVRIPVRPFPGTIGVALAEPGNHSIVPPRRNGGNMDIKHLVVGARLRLPVLVPGALFSVGDTHAAQGDGEVCGTAIESGMTIALRFTLHKGRSIPEPEYLLPPAALAPLEPVGYQVCTGFSPDLLEASRKAVRHLIAHLQETRGLTREEAYALCSVCADLRISQVVDAPNWLVSAFLPLSVFER